MDINKMSPATIELLGPTGEVEQEGSVCKGEMPVSYTDIEGQTNKVTGLEDGFKVEVGGISFECRTSDDWIKLSEGRCIHLVPFRKGN